MKRTWKAKEVIKGWDGKPIRLQAAEDLFDDKSPVEMRDMTVAAAMLVVANSFPCETLEDSSKKKALKQALLASQKSGSIELDAEVYAWLKAAAAKVAPRAWQDNANEVNDVIAEGYRKENEPSKSQKALAAGKGKAAE